MEKKIVIEYSGWITVHPDDVYFVDWSGESPVINLATAWLKMRGNLDGLTLENFNEAEDAAIDSVITQLDISVEDGN